MRPPTPVFATEAADKSRDPANSGASDPANSAPGIRNQAGASSAPRSRAGEARPPLSMRVNWRVQARRSWSRRPEPWPAQTCVSAVKILREAESIDSKAEGAAELATAITRISWLKKVNGRSRAQRRLQQGFKRTTEAMEDFNRAVQLLELLRGGHKDLGVRQAEQRGVEGVAIRARFDAT